MQKLRDFFSTSEGWGSFVAAVLTAIAGFLVSKGLITQSVADMLLQLILTFLGIAIAGFAKKAVKPGSIPFVPDAK